MVPTEASAEARELRERVRALVLARGFARVGFTGAHPVEDRVSGWTVAGLHAGMAYMARAPERRSDPATLLPGVRTVISAAAAYPATDARGPIAGYARGEDYHRTLKAALRAAVTGIEALLPGVRTRVCVDSAPLAERAFAARAGLGWIGRNTLLLDEQHGPWLLLGEILLDRELVPDEPAVDRCGTCTACVQACPTGALDGRRNLDANRCLSYWTIEHRGKLPDDVAAELGSRVFGCDDCLTACPFPARNAAPSAAFERRADLVEPSLDELAEKAEAAFWRHFGSTPLERARKSGLLRNLAAARANAR